MTIKKSAFKQSMFTLVLMAGIVLCPIGHVHADENTLQRIQREGVLHAATEPAFEPFEFMQGDQIVGYGTDILHEVAKQLNVKLDQQGMSLNAILPSLLAHKVDLAATTLAATPERERKVAFTYPIAERTLVIVTRSDNTDIHNKTDFSGKIVGLQQGSALVSEFETLNNYLRLEKHQGFSKVIGYQTFNEIFLALKSKQIEATAVSLPLVAHCMKRYPGEFKIVGAWDIEYNKEKYNYYWAVRKEDKELKAFVDNVIETLEKNGTLNTLQKKWFGQPLNELKVTSTQQ